MRTLVIALMLFTGAAAAGEIHSKHWIYGLPTGAPDTSDLIIRDSYALMNNGTTKFADWVAYRVTPQEAWGSLDLERKWRADPWIPADERLEPSNPDDFKNSGYDRGHMAPLAAFKGSEDASQVNYYSNIAPQKGPMNQGPWEKIEAAVREFVKAGNVVWVMTGTLYESPMEPMAEADEPHTVPSAYWKVVATCNNWEGNCTFNVPKVAAFIIEQSAGRNDPVVGVTLEDIESRSGLDIYPDIIGLVADDEWLMGN